jgi:hypothetical protein
MEERERKMEWEALRVKISEGAPVKSISLGGVGWVACTGIPGDREYVLFWGAGIPLQKLRRTDIIDCVKEEVSA